MAMPRRMLNLLIVAIVATGAASLGTERLPNTELLTLPENLVATCLQQVQGYFLRQIQDAQKLRDVTWTPDFTSAEAYEKSLAGHRASCRKMLGLEESVVAQDEVKTEIVGQTASCRIERITIPTKARVPVPVGQAFQPDAGRTDVKLESLTYAARALLLLPNSPGRRPAVIVSSDADTWPEKAAGLTHNAQPPRWLGELLGRGAAVCLLQSIERLQDHPYCKQTNGKDRRMILYRLGYVVGRTMPGLDVQDALTVVESLSRRPDVDPSRIGLLGFGQGGMTALYTAATDGRVSAAVVADYFQKRDRCWEEPVDRRLPGQLLEFGDAEVAALVAPRFLTVVHSAVTAGAQDAVASEARRAVRFYDGLKAGNRFSVATVGKGEDPAARSASLVADALGLPPVQAGAVVWPAERISEEKARARRDLHFEERLCYLRKLIEQSEAIRQRRWGLTTRPPTGFPKIKAAMLDEYRKLVGHVPTEGTPLRPRSELALATEKYKAYRILLDVTDGVQLYGNLLVPHNVEGRMPAVICQHGLSGTPEMITGLGQKEDTPYHKFGRRLAERGYVVLAPLILHYHPVQWTNDQARQADAVGTMRVAMVVAQTQRAVDFLETLPFVDPQRIGYYGLSYGGYSAIWVSPLVDRLAATVVSGHFNDWRSKITSDATATSYLLHPDEDFYNWDILHRFTHVELIAMTAPRPVCIEFGLRDGITTPQWTAYAWKQLAAIRDHLGLADRITLAQFDGVHEVHGVESFAFLDRFLKVRKKTLALPVGR